MLQFLYVTDLHGWTEGYQAVLDVAEHRGIEIIVNGGDLLPKGGSLHSSLSEVATDGNPPPIFGVQKRFIDEFFPEYFARCQQLGIDYYATFGSDDLKCHWPRWCQQINRFGNVHELSTAWHAFGDGYWLRGCSYVPDVPFRLKDWALRDDQTFKSPPQLASPVVSGPHGLTPIDGLSEFLDGRPTLQGLLQEMQAELGDVDPKKVIIATHSPPAGTGLGLVHDGKDVGSAATAAWIQQFQPHLTLHGHIHESPKISGRDTASIGRTTCHNPGQFAPHRVAMSIITISDQRVDFERLMIEPGHFRSKLSRSRRPRSLPVASPAPTAKSPQGTLSLRNEASGQPLDDNVQFSVYRPKVIRPRQWYPLLAFAHLEDLPVDAGDDQPHPVAEVKRQAEAVLGAKFGQFTQMVQDSSQAVPRYGELTFIPVLDGCEFNPPRQSVRWIETVHKVEFRVRAEASLDGGAARGRMSVFLGSILLADISLRFKVDSQHVHAQGDESTESSSAKPYRRIFASYSHKDLAVVEQFETYVETLGDRYLRDCKELRAGEKWDDRLLQMIREADVFQLFWSHNSMRSEYVRREWEFAVSLSDKGPYFVRPIYWEEPMPSDAVNDLPPRELRKRHFTCLAEAPQRPEPSKTGVSHMLIRIGGDVCGTDRYQLGCEAVRIGRSAKCEVTVQCNLVSAHHAKIQSTNAVFEIEDLGSTNGTYVNGQRVHRGILREGDRIRIGTAEFVFRTVDVPEFARESVAESSDAVDSAFDFDIFDTASSPFAPTLEHDTADSEWSDDRASRLGPANRRARADGERARIGAATRWSSRKSSRPRIEIEPCRPQASRSRLRLFAFIVVASLLLIAGLALTAIYLGFL